MRATVAERVRTMNCGGHNDDDECHRCNEDAHVIGAMMLEWKTAFPIEAKPSLANLDLFCVARQVACLLDPDKRTWPTNRIWNVLELPDEPRIDISRETAAQLDVLTKGRRFRKALRGGSHGALLAEYAKFCQERRQP